MSKRTCDHDGCPRPPRPPREPRRSTFEWRTARECPGCACLFTPLHTPNTITCSIMQIARRFGYLCAYCGERDGQLEPPRATNWAPEDKRYWHLTDARAISPAA